MSMSSITGWRFGMIVLAGVLGLTFVSTDTARAQDRRPAPGVDAAEVLERTIPRLVRELRLDREQAESVREIGRDFVDAVKAWHRDRRARADEIRDEMNRAREADDRDRLRELAGHYRAVQREQFEEEPYFRRIMGVLRPHQQERFQQMIGEEMNPDRRRHEDHRREPDRRDGHRPPRDPRMDDRHPRGPRSDDRHPREPRSDDRPPRPEPGQFDRQPHRFDEHHQPPPRNPAPNGQHPEEPVHPMPETGGQEHDPIESLLDRSEHAPVVQDDYRPPSKKRRLDL
ncbi:MAG: hypothetical protein R3336_04245 [Phycisphaeraceae bacterium]|nr:hypothetical protein [Phycisphaeraceae bacterium]